MRIRYKNGEKINIVGIDPGRRLEAAGVRFNKYTDAENPEIIKIKANYIHEKAGYFSRKGKLAQLTKHIETRQPLTKERIDHIAFTKERLTHFAFRQSYYSQKKLSNISIARMLVNE